MSIDRYALLFVICPHHEKIYSTQVNWILSLYSPVDSGLCPAAARGVVFLCLDIVL